MAKRLLCVFLALFCFISVSISSVSADDMLDLSDLYQCKKLYSYSGKSHAYFYGCCDKTLYSAEVIPSTVARYVSVSGYIRAVCHDENNAYALYDGSKKSYEIVRMNMDSGSCSYYNLNVGNASNRSFAVCGNEIFIIQNSSSNPYVQSYGANGQALYSYTFSAGVECLFNNGGSSYAKVYSGEIYRLSGGTETKCANLEAYTEFTDAGSGYILTSDKRLISLNGGAVEQLNCDFEARTDKLTFTLSGASLNFSGGSAEVSSAKMLCAAGSKAAVLNSDYGCEVINSSDHLTQNQPVQNRTGASGEKLTISGGCIIGIEPEITVTQAKKRYPQIKKILNENKNEITSGNLRTGYFAVLGNGTYELALRGDVNLSGTLNTADISEFMRSLSGEISLSAVSQKAADYNFDGKSDTKDLVLIAQKVYY